MEFNIQLLKVVQQYPLGNYKNFKPFRSLQFHNCHLTLFLYRYSQNQCEAAFLFCLLAQRCTFHSKVRLIVIIFHCTAVYASVFLRLEGEGIITSPSRKRQRFVGIIRLV